MATTRAHEDPGSEAAPFSASHLQDCEVLSSSTIAAPAFVEAAVRERFEQAVEVADRVLVLRRAAVDDPDVVLPVAAEDENGRLMLFPTEGTDVLCLADTGDLG